MNQPQSKMVPSTTTSESPDITSTDQVATGMGTRISSNAVANTTSPIINAAPKDNPHLVAGVVVVTLLFIVAFITIVATVALKKHYSKNKTMRTCNTLQLKSCRVQPPPVNTFNPAAREHGDEMQLNSIAMASEYSYPDSLEGWDPTLPVSTSM